MGDLIKTRDLSVLAGEIRAEHEAVVAGVRATVEAAIRCGLLLQEAKTAVPHGQWRGWVKANFPASLRTAQQYMQVAERADDARRVAHLGLRGTLKALASPAATETVGDETEGIDLEVARFERDALARGGDPEMVKLEASILRADKCIEWAAHSLLGFADESEAAGHARVAAAGRRWAHLLLADPSPLELAEVKADARAEFRAAIAEAQS